MITVVNLSQLRLVAHVAPEATLDLAIGDPIECRLATGKEQIESTVEFISPVVDAASGTVRTKLLLDNASGAYRAGEKYQISLPGPSMNLVKSSLYPGAKLLPVRGLPVE